MLDTKLPLEIASLNLTSNIEC